MPHSRPPKSLSTAAILPDGKAAPPVRRSIAFRAWLTLFFGANFATLVLLWSRHYFWAVPVFFLPAPWYAFQILKASAQSLGPVVTHFKTNRREVWLTIDDGPDPESTPAVLNLLDAHTARATFFLIGEKVKRHPELVTEILRRGHTIGNHTHTHPCSWFWCASARKTAAEIDACTDALQNAGTRDIHWFRSPVGLKNHALHALLAKRGLDLVLWNARGFDTICHQPAKVIARLATNLKPGSILLLHENASRPALQTELFGRLFAHLEREGYTCVIPQAEDLIREG